MTESNVKRFKSRDQLTKEQLKADLCKAVDEDDYIIVVSHQDKDNITGIITNLNFCKDRIGLKGMMQEATEIIFRIAPPIVFEGDDGYGH